MKQQSIVIRVLGLMLAFGCVARDAGAQARLSVGGFFVPYSSSANLETGSGFGLQLLGVQFSDGSIDLTLDVSDHDFKPVSAFGEYARLIVLNFEPKFYLRTEPKARPYLMVGGSIYASIDARDRDPAGYERSLAEGVGVNFGAGLEYHATSNIALVTGLVVRHLWFHADRTLGVILPGEEERAKKFSGSSATVKLGIKFIFGGA
jgi:hypothetical protein